MLAASSVVVLFLLGDAVIRGGVAETALLAPWPLLALWGVYVSAFASSLEVDEQGATMQNMLRVVRMPWARVRGLQWRWQVIFDLDNDSHVRAIGGPVQGRGGRRPGRVEDTSANSRAQYDYVQRLYEQADATGNEAVRHGWDVPALIALAVLVVWAVFAVVITSSPQ